MAVCLWFDCPGQHEAGLRLGVRHMQESMGTRSCGAAAPSKVKMRSRGEEEEELLVD